MPHATSLAPSPFSRWMISCCYHAGVVPFVNLLSVAAHGLLPGRKKELHDTQIYMHRPDLIIYVSLREKHSGPFRSCF